MASTRPELDSTARSTDLGDHVVLLQPALGRRAAADDRRGPRRLPAPPARRRRPSRGRRPRCPSQPCETVPDSISSAAICRTRSIGMAKPNAASLPARSVVMPMTAPLASTSGPPDQRRLDRRVGLDQAVERLAGGVETPLDRADHARGDRRLAVGSVGQPSAMAGAPDREIGRRAEDGDREVAASMDTTATSVGRSAPMTSPSRSTPIRQLHRHGGRAGDLVGAGEHEAVVADHHAGGRRGAVVAGHHEVDDGRSQLLGQGGDARLVLEDRVG